MEESRGNHLIGLSTAFIVGAALGAGIAILFAPASGRAVRRKIRQASEKAYAAGREKVNEAFAKVKGRMKEGESVEA